MPRVDVVIPVYNEEAALEKSILALREFLQKNCPIEWTVVVANNASTDSTIEIAKRLAERFQDVRYVHLDVKGRGRALRKAWLESDADIVAYMDVDLSTNLRFFPPLIQALVDGYDVAIGSRLMSASRVTRTLKREVISRCYNLLVRALFFTSFSDAQCGFKALTRLAARKLIPLVKDESWFFDTELLILAEKKGYRIKEVPVEWIEDLDSRVHIVRTATDDIKGLLRVRFHRLP
ncbi:MAG: glycosyltransferase family 2 protein [Chloroflexota bacterium]|nr:MAG: glycosyltransferase family 2 protein [Chloroflexota bacterium]